MRRILLVRLTLVPMAAGGGQPRRTGGGRLQRTQRVQSQLSRRLLPVRGHLCRDGHDGAVCAMRGLVSRSLHGSGAICFLAP
jgi:hypothetical protein